jgi:hypothetical protein
MLAGCHNPDSSETPLARTAACPLASFVSRTKLTLGETNAMTVCIAIRSEGMLFIASDKLLTAGDIQFEPAARKIDFVTNSIAIMFSGDANLHGEILQPVIRDVNQRISANPKQWLNVKDVAALYVQHRNAVKRQRAEARILAPLGLTVERFLKEHNSLNAELAKSIAGDLVNFYLPALDVIVCGVDDRMGPNKPLPTIHTISDGELGCSDTVAFAAIGSGSRHAESRLMLARHSFLTPNAEALFTLLAAKRDAEIAPGVGPETDIFAIGPGLGQHSPIGGELRERFEKAYDKMKSQTAKIHAQTIQEISRYVEEFAKRNAATEQAQPSAPDGKPPPRDGGDDASAQ